MNLRREETDRNLRGIVIFLHYDESKNGETERANRQDA
jgi:hypothetical protein